MKRLFNDPRAVVREMLEGFADLTPGVALLDGENILVRTDLPHRAGRKVAVISGGGSGHEPAHAGYVGTGMLTAAVAGDVFTSPSVDAIVAALRACAGPAGALLVVKNYTGDRLNFALAAEIAQAEGIPVEIAAVADDVALRDLVEPHRRRGIAGTIFVHKIAGAAAETGRSLAQVATLARQAASEVGTMGVGLGACTVPTAGKPGFELGENEIELGLGIHGEKGVSRSNMRPADALVDTILDAIIADRGLARGERVVLLVNGLGGTTQIELSIVARRALATLRQRGIEVARAWSGNFMTALEMPGCSLSLMQVNDAQLALLDQPCDAPAWPGPGHIPLQRKVVQAIKAPALTDRPATPPGPLAPVLRQAALAVAAALETAEPELTELDAKAGDGDLGASMTRGAAAIRALPEGSWATPETALTEVGDTLRRAVAGSSGPFYATALMRAARRLAGQPEPDADAWSAAFAEAVSSVSEIGGAKPGDRSMVDALQPALDAWREARSGRASASDAWDAAVSAAEEGARRTANMMPRLGRATYLGERALGVQDGGAVAVTVWMRAIATFMRDLDDQISPVAGACNRRVEQLDCGRRACTETPKPR